MKFILKQIILLYSYILTYCIRLFTKVHENRIIMWANKGDLYSCNPKYITEYLLNTVPNQYEIIWAFNNEKNILDIPEKIKTIRKTNLLTKKLPSLQFIYHINTSKFIVTNFRLHRNEILNKRTGQYYIQTWHGCYGFKKIEADVTHKYSYNKENKLIDLMISSCPMRTEEIRRSQGYTGEVLQKGDPRVDIFFNTKALENIKQKVFNYFNIPTNKKILLYAPTFRDRDIDSLDVYQLDWDRIIKTLNNKFNSEFYILLRLHPNLLNRIKDISLILSNPNVLDARFYPDMQELLVASSILLTDYSSSPFDFCYTKRPIFLYTPDLKQYTTIDRGELNFDLNTLPFSYAETQEELIQNILTFDYNKYQHELDFFLTNILQTSERGHACEEFYKWMQQH